MYAKYEVLISYGSKVIGKLKVKVDDGQKNGQTHRKDKFTLGALQTKHKIQGQLKENSSFLYQISGIFHGLLHFEQIFKEYTCQGLSQENRSDFVHNRVTASDKLDIVLCI